MQQVTDHVTIKSKDWYDNHCDKWGNVHVKGDMVLNYDMSVYCGKSAILTQKNKHFVKIDLDGGLWNWNEEMFE